MSMLTEATAIKSTYQSIVQGPFDSRSVVETYEDLTNPETWKTARVEGQRYYSCYKGMVVAVQENCKMYILKSLTQEDVHTAPTAYEWVEIGASSEATTSGRSIDYIGEPAVEGQKATYTIYYTDQTTSTFTVTNGKDGKSAYEIWREQEGNSDKSEETFVRELRGSDGVSVVGAAAGAVETEGNYTVTPITFTRSQGDPLVVRVLAEKGADGKDGTGVNIKGTVADEDSLPESGLEGEAYLVKGYLYVWDSLKKNDLGGIEPGWTKVGEIQGPAGRGIEQVALQSGTPGQAGAKDTYVITYSDKTTSTFEVYNGVDGKDGTNGASGKDGTNGVDGKDGETPRIGANGNWWIGETDQEAPSRGPEGKSAFQVWEAMAGNKGKTEQDFIEALRGPEVEIEVVAQSSSATPSAVISSIQYDSSTSTLTYISTPISIDDGELK